MTDERYAFVEDVKNRKNVAKSGGKKGKSRYGCTLPSDYFSAKEKRDINSKWISITYDRPISYDKFLAYSDDDKKNYLQNLIDTYGGDTGKIAKMFGCTEAKIRVFRQDLGIKSANRTISNMSPTSLWETFLTLNDFLRKPMSIDDFKTLDWYDQKDYIRFLIEEKGFTCYTISEKLFGLNGTSLRNYLNSHNIPYHKHPRNYHMTDKLKEELKEWLGYSDKEETEMKEDQNQNSETASLYEDCLENYKPKTTAKTAFPTPVKELENLQVNFTVGSMDEIEPILNMLPKAKSGTITINFGGD